jgi:type VI secretion system protein ImpC
MNSSTGGLHLEFTYRRARAPRPRAPQEPFRVLALADFSARAAGGRCESLASRRVRRVDSDRLEAVLASFAATLSLPVAGAEAPRETVSFSGLGDLHPDGLLARVPSLKELLAARRELDSPTAASAAEKLQQLLKAPAPPAAADTGTSPTPPATATRESVDETLSRLLGKDPAAPAPAAPPPPKPRGFDLQAAIKQIVGPAAGTAPAAPAGAAGLAAAAEFELTARLRRILHDPGFRELESAWRGLDFLVRRCPDEERIALFALDASLAELAADPGRLERMLAQHPWDAIAAHYTFGESRSDLDVLAALAQVCQRLDTTWLAAAHPRLVGCAGVAALAELDTWQPASDVREAWQTLRASEPGAHVALALPRFLLRQPYGHANDPIEGFPFEELPAAAEHEEFPWGNPVWLRTLVRMENVAADRPVEAAGEVGGLPVYVLAEDNESEMVPCAEVWLNDKAVTALAAEGLTPLISIRGRDAVRMPAG